MLRFVLSAGVAGVCATMSPVPAQAWEVPAGSPPGWRSYWVQTSASADLFADAEGDLSFGHAGSGMYFRVDAPEQNGRLWVYNPNVEGWAWLSGAHTQPVTEPTLDQVQASARPLDPRAYLYQQAPDLAPRLDCIIGYESGWNAFSQNPRSKASGLAQFLPSTWASTPSGQLGLSPFDPYANIDAAIWLARSIGWTQWEVYLVGRCR